MTRRRQARKVGTALFRRARLASVSVAAFLVLLVVSAVGFDAWRTYRHNFAEARDSLASVNRLLGEHTARTGAQERPRRFAGGGEEQLGKRLGHASGMARFCAS